jgi:cytochrome c oxidase assembly protein subunit 15
VLVWWLARTRAAGRDVRRSLTALCELLALQGVVGVVQYETHLPSELVWVHVGLACAAWLAALWAVWAAGRLAPRAVSAAADGALWEPIAAQKVPVGGPSAGR